MTDPTRPIRVAVQLQPQHADYQQIRDAVLRAEELGVDLVMNWDHFFPLYGDPVGKHFECWTMLAAWAEQTDRVEIGALVSGGGYRNPDLLADMARTVDHISGGRLVLGVGGGWFEKDYDAYGYDFGTPGSRLRLLGDNLQRIGARLGQLNPPPTRTIPLLIGGGGERKTLRLVAEHAHIWHCFGDLNVLRHKSTVLGEHCASLGRDPQEIERSAAAPEGPGGEESLDALADLGFTLFTVGVNGPNYDLGPLRPLLAWRDARNAG